MSDWADLEDLWSDNPRLHAWLAAQRDAFAGWALQTGQEWEWDFTPGSLAVLEDWLRNRFEGPEQVAVARDEPAVSVPAWYFGEVKNRHAGTVWHCRPEFDPVRNSYPFVITPITDEQLARLEEWGELYEDEDYRPTWFPMDEVTEVTRRDKEHHLTD